MEAVVLLAGHFGSMVGQSAVAIPGLEKILNEYIRPILCHQSKD